MGKKERKFNPRPKIEYPPVPTRKWIPPDQRPKKKPKPAYVKPPGISQPLKISSLGKVWHNFRIVEGRTFLLGSFSETHKRFRPRSNGYQTPCNCIIAIVFSKLYDMSKWSTAMLDKTLELGDHHYLKSLNLLQDRNKTFLRLCEVYPAFYLEETKVTATTKGKTYHGKLFQDYDGTPVLSDVIQEFFDDQHDSGIIFTQCKYMAFWFNGKDYFFFDSTDHNELGLPWYGIPGCGHAVVIRLRSAKDLVGVIHKNTNQRENSRFVITPCGICRMVKLNLEPPEGKLKLHCPDEEPSVVKYLSARVPEKPEPLVEEEEEELGVEVLEEELEEEEDPQEVIDEYSPDVDVAASRTPSEYQAAGMEPQEAIKHTQVPESLIPVERPKAESVTYFLSLIPDKMGILRASTHQCDRRFSKHDGKQTIANAIAALTMLRIHKSKAWIKKILDEVLLAGEDIYKESLKQLPKDAVLKVTTVSRKITLRDKHFTPEVEEFSAVGQLQSDKDEVVDLLPALQEFFRDNEACVLTGPLSLAIWLEDGFFYMFDPNERDRNGLVIIKSLQVGSDLQVLEYIPGVACVTWYKSLKDLVEVYMNNVERNLRRDPFVVSRVQINDLAAVPSPWHNFRGIARGKWILCGTFNQNDRRFDKETRNTQSTAIASLALAYSRIKHVKEWTTADVDEVTLQGDALYKICVDYLKECNKYTDPKLNVGELPKKFPLEGKEVNLDIQDCLVNGLLDAGDDNDALNLKKGIKEFFKENETGVLTTRSISVAIWKNEEVYYYYDSHSRDDKGVINHYGTACVMRILTVDDLAKSIEANLEPDTSNTYNINRVGVTIWEVAQDGVIRPPLNNYTEISESAAILRSLFHERSQEFGLNRGKQTVPMCLVALGMIKLYPAAIWSRDVIDEVLHVGDKLYMNTMIERECNSKLREEDDIDEVYPENCQMDYSIGMNHFTLNYGDAIEGNFEEDFQEALALHFNSGDSQNEDDLKELLVSSDVYTVVVWKEKGVYFLFDPKPRDITGQVYGKEEWSLKPIEGEGEFGDEDFLQGIVNGERVLNITELGDGDASGVLDEGSSMLKRSVGSQATEQGEDARGGLRKHSAQYWRAMEEESGKACAMWFTTLDKLIAHILENTPPTKRLDIAFKLLPVHVSTKIVTKDVFDPSQNAARPDYYAGDWYEFKEIDHGRWILRGTMDFMHVMFPEHNRGRQSIAMCYAALAYVKRFALSKFKPITVNDVLKYGDRLYSATRRLRYKELKKNNKELRLSEEEMQTVLNREHYGLEEIARAFCIGTDQMRADITERVLEGDIKAYDVQELYDVKRALEAYFGTHRTGILVSKESVVAIWRGARVFYMFDPDSRGPSGLGCTNGDACITRYLDLDTMASVFVANVPKDEHRNNFAIHRVAIRMVPCPREPKPEEKERPDEPKYNGYTMVMPGKSILRGTTSHEGDRYLPGAPIAIVALAMTLIHKASNWTKPIVDEILSIGEELYAETLDALGFDFNPWEQEMTVHLVNKDFKIGVVKANCELRTMDQRGVIDVKHPQVLNIRQGIERFFEENTHGVIETETLTVAIWEEEDQQLVYMFDPNPRGPAGYNQPGGTACVLSFESHKDIADHFIANVEKPKRTGQFVVTPVEIVVGNMRTRPKKHKDPCMDQGQKPTTPKPSPAEIRKMRDIAKEDHRRKEARKLAELGKMEYHAFSNGDAILRGSRSQNSSRYSELSRDKQDLPNCIAAFVVHRLVPISEWCYRHINMVLDAGDQLYKDSYIIYEPPNPKLGLRNVLREIFVKDVQVSLVIYKPVMSNILTAYNLEVALMNYFQQEHFGILSAYEQHVGLFFKTGLYYMFDPHDRDVDGARCSSGSACVLRFAILSSLVEKFMKNVVTMFDSIKMFKITPVCIGSINRVVECE